MDPLSAGVLALPWRGTVTAAPVKDGRPMGGRGDR